MTSVAFIMGVVPLVLSTGAGAEMRQAMGIAVFAGMLGVTFFGLFLTPVFYVVVQGVAVAAVAPARRCVATGRCAGRRGGSLIMRTYAHVRPCMRRARRARRGAGRGVRGAYHAAAGVGAGRRR